MDPYDSWIHNDIVHVSRERNSIFSLFILLAKTSMSVCKWRGICIKNTTCKEDISSSSPWLELPVFSLILVTYFTFPEEHVCSQASRVLITNSSEIQTRIFVYIYVYTIINHSQKWKTHTEIWHIIREDQWEETQLLIDYWFETYRVKYKVCGIFTFKFESSLWEFWILWTIRSWHTIVH